ncbi:hypothetical protein ACFV1C_00155 [Streptomyces sp. NPDC059605]|uniref:hypothetical protein n=1 Tax=Streptomyces sp. NPDC059605 TaxID=3346882 RepID=UPI003686BF7B
MTPLPRTIPTYAAGALAAALAYANVQLGPIKPGTRVTRTVDHGGNAWELTYLGSATWRLTGPGAEHGIAMTVEDAVELITANVPNPGPPETYLGVHVPVLIRETWGQPLADGWCLGVHNAVTR